MLREYFSDEEVAKGGDKAQFYNFIMDRKD
jgi:hypothetical protein